MTKKVIALDALTEEQQEAFVNGWEAAGGPVCVWDDSPCPWCAPWTWGGSHEIETESDRPEDWGAQWWEENRAEVDALIAQDEESED